jgi:glycosyltransferase involved in cell wall biosynthesis
MRVWFALGIEPWFLPPAVEMGHALTAQGHDVRAFYVGDPPKAGDELDFPTQPAPRRGGIWRVMAAADLATALRRSLAADDWPDLIVACDLVALQAARSLRRRIGALGYWAFEIVEPPTSFRLSADAWRASRLSHWIRDCDVVLAPSASRLHRVTRFARPSTLSLVVPNCRCDRRHSSKPVAVAEAHRVSKLPRRLVYAGRVSPTQYVHHIVNALRFLPEDVGLVVAGIAFPEYRGQLDEQVQRYNLSERCLLLDRVSRAQTDALVAQATLGFVLYDSAADVGAADPAPNKVGDYATLGVPMVGTPQQYLRYWLEERGLGVCVTDASPKAIAAATCALLDPTRLARARASCALAARGDLNMSLHATKLVEALQETPGRATAGRPLRSREQRLARAD